MCDYVCMLCLSDDVVVFTLTQMAALCSGLCHVKDKV
jgi:hypothetical protein